MTEAERTTPAPESATPSSTDAGDVIVASKPDWMGDEEWRKIRGALLDHIDGLVEEVTAAEPCPAGTPWCRQHEEGDGGWCTSRSLRYVDRTSKSGPSGASGEAFIDVTTGTDDGEAVLFGLSTLPDGVPLRDARYLVDALSLLLREVGA